MAELDVAFVSNNVTRGNGGSATLLDALRAVGEAGNRTSLYLTSDRAMSLLRRPSRRRLAAVPISRIYTPRGRDWRGFRGAELLVVSGLCGLDRMFTRHVLDSNAQRILSHSGSCESFRLALAEALPGRSDVNPDDLYREYVESFDFVVFQTADIRDEAVELARRLSDRSFVVRPSTDEDAVRASVGAESPYRAGRLPIVMVGPIVPRKGQHFALEAFALVASRVPRADLHFVGHTKDAAYAEQLQALAAERSLTDRVHLHGHQLESLKFVAHASVMMHTSLAEGASRVIRESMLLGRPCIAFDIPGTRDLIVHEKSGLLVSEGDVGALGAALLKVLQDEATAAALGASARRRYDKGHAWPIYRSSWESALSAMADRSPRIKT